MIEKNLLIDMGVSLPQGTNWDDVTKAITDSIIEIVEKLDGMCGGGVRFEEFNYDEIEADLDKAQDEADEVEVQFLEEKMLVHV